MAQNTSVKADAATIRRNKIRTYFSKPHNVILLLMGIVLTFTTGDILLNLYRRAGYEGRQNAGGKKQILFQYDHLFHKQLH